MMPANNNPFNRVSGVATAQGERQQQQQQQQQATAFCGDYATAMGEASRKRTNKSIFPSQAPVAQLGYPIHQRKMQKTSKDSKPASIGSVSRPSGVPFPYSSGKCNWLMHYGMYPIRTNMLAH